MKKSILLSGIAATAILASCGNSTRVTLSTPADSLAYAISMARTEGLNETMYNQLGVDSAYVGEFVKGVREAFNGSAEDKKAIAYKAGLQIGLTAERVYQSANNEIYPNDSVNSIDRNIFLSALIAGATGKGQMTMQEAQDYYLRSVYMTESDKFMAENKEKEGVVTTESGLQYKVENAGDESLHATPTDTVKCIYRGTLTNGRQFDSSRGQAVSFPVNGVIAGWTEALQMMGKGAKWTLYVPWNLAYGEQGTRGIPPYSALIFDVEVTEIIPAAQK